MLWIDNILSRLGIGGATVDTLLPERSFHAGEKISAEIVVTGGRDSQNIEGLHFVLYCTYEKTESLDRHDNEDDDYYEGDLVDVEYNDDDEIRTYVCHAELTRFSLENHFTIQPSEVQRLKLDFSLPIATPQTRDRTRVWLSTDLDIKRAVDAKDKDYIQVQAPLGVQLLYDALENIGFVLHESRCEATQIDFGLQLPFVQEFAFRPESGFFKNKLEELEVIFLQQGDTIEILIEKDRQVNGLRGWMSRIEDLDEVDIRQRFTLQALQDPELHQQLHQLLSEQLSTRNTL